MTEHHVHERHVTPVRFGTLQTGLNLPSPEGETFDHQLDGLCWCQPLVEDVPPDGRIYIHRRSLDSPHIEIDA